MAIKIFDKLYVGLREQGNDQPRLGFATPYEKNAAFEKRKLTVDTWVRSYLTSYDYKTKQTITKTVIEPLMLDNVPRSGFKITDDVKRVYWGGGNVVWRVLDPEGFELEISSSNLMALIQTVGIDKGGLINGKCGWARDGQQNVLLHEHCDEYKNAFTVDRAVKFTPAMLKIGDMVNISASKTPVQYLGRYYLAEYNRNAYGKQPGLKVDRYFFFKINQGDEDYLVWYTKPKLFGKAGVSVVNNPMKIVDALIKKKYQYSHTVYSNVFEKLTEFTLGFAPIKQENIADILLVREEKALFPGENLNYRTNNKTQDYSKRYTYFYDTKIVERNLLIAIDSNGQWFNMNSISFIVDRAGFLTTENHGWMGSRDIDGRAKITKMIISDNDITFVFVDVRDLVSIDQKIVGRNVSKEQLDQWLRTLQFGVLTIDKK